VNPFFPRTPGCRCALPFKTQIGVFDLHDKRHVTKPLRQWGQAKLLEKVAIQMRRNYVDPRRWLYLFLDVSESCSAHKKSDIAKIFGFEGLKVIFFWRC